jgi:hypothetical protein
VLQQSPGLYLTANVLLPSGMDVSFEPEINPALVGPRETLLLELAGRSVLTRWAAGQAERWTAAELTDWTVSPSSSRSYSVATATLRTGPRTDPFLMTDQGLRPPNPRARTNPTTAAEFGMQLQVGRQPSSSAPPLLLATSVGIYPEHAARLQLSELYGLLMALMWQVGTAWLAWDALVPGHPKPTEMDLSLELEPTARVEQLLDVGTVAQQGTGSVQLLEQWSIATNPPNFLIDLELVKQTLNSAMNGWLIDNKYRNVEAAIEAAAQAYRPD